MSLNPILRLLWPSNNTSHYHHQNHNNSNYQDTYWKSLSWTKRWAILQHWWPTFFKAVLMEKTTSISAMKCQQLIIQNIFTTTNTTKTMTTKTTRTHTGNFCNVGWPDVLFSPDMSSFWDLKNASGRDSKNVLDFASSDICVSLGLSQTSYYPLQVLEMVSRLRSTFFRELWLYREQSLVDRSQCCQIHNNYPPNTTILSLWYDPSPFPIWQHWAPCRLH